MKGSQYRNFEGETDRNHHGDLANPLYSDAVSFKNLNQFFWGLLIILHNSRLRLCSKTYLSTT